MKRCTVVLFSLAVGVPGLAQTADMTLLEEVRELAQRMTALRATEPPLDPPPLAVRASEQVIRQAAASRAVGLLPQDRMAARERAWADLGFRSAGFPGSALGRIAEDLAGFGADREGNRILVHDDRLTDEDFFSERPNDPTIALLQATGVRPDEPAIIHNLIHLVQHRRQGGEYEPTTDRLLAEAAMAEGEANLVAVMYLFQALGLQRHILSMGYTPDQALNGALMPPDLEGMPELDRKVLDFVFMDGFEAASFAFRRTNWEGLERRFALVRTTHDLLHVRRPPARTPMPEVVPPDLPDTYRVQDRDSIGELGVILLVSALTGKEDLGLQAGDGWAADRLLRMEPEAGAGDPTVTGATRWVSLWKNEVEAAQFEELYRRGMAENGPEGERVLSITRGGSRVEVMVLPPHLAPAEKEPESERSLQAGGS